jgi:hypothetical protein
MIPARLLQPLSWFLLLENLVLVFLSSLFPQSNGPHWIARKTPQRDLDCHSRWSRNDFSTGFRIWIRCSWYCGGFYLKKLMLHLFAMWTWSGLCFSPQHTLLCLDSLTRWPSHASSVTLDRQTIRPGLIVYDNSRYVGFWLVFVEMCAVVDELFVLCFVAKPWSTDIDPMHVSAALLLPLLHIDWWIVLLRVSFTTQM